MGILSDGAKIIYDALTFNNSIEAIRKAENAMKKASASMESLKNYISSTPEAGGGLSVGGTTVAGLIAERARRTENNYNILVEGRKKLETARDILGGFGKVFNVFTGGLYGALKDMITRGANGISEFLDGLASGDPDAVLGGAFDKRCYNDLNSSGTEGVSPHGLMWAWSYTQRINDNQTVSVANDNLVYNCYYALISFFQMTPEEITRAKTALNDKKTDLYLHLNGIGTAHLSGTWPVEQVLFLPGAGNESKLTVYLGDLFDAFDSIPAGVSYTVDLLVDDKLVVSFGGVTQ